MGKIIVNYQPFTVQQAIYVVENDKVIDCTSVELDRVDNAVEGLSLKYHITDIELHGNNDYLYRFDQEMRQHSTFANNPKNIVIVTEE